MPELTSYEKDLIATRYWLLGCATFDAAYHQVLAAMEFSRAHHNGTRNGGDPEFSHQLGIFQHVRTLHRHLRDPVTVYTLIFLHDCVEDRNKATGKLVSLGEVRERFGERIEAKVRLLSKEVHGVKNTAFSLPAVFEDADCSVVKGGDRVHNVSTMVGVFKPERMRRYVVETTEHYLPGLRAARRLHPDQEAVYENIKLELQNQLALIGHIMSLSPTDLDAAHQGAQALEGAAAPHAGLLPL